MAIGKGGPGRGQGRKPLVAGSDSVVLQTRMSVEQKAKAQRLGAQWLRTQIDKAKDPAVGRVAPRNKIEGWG